MDKIAVLIPCYNESRTIEKVIRDWQKTLPESVIYVYDNNSSIRLAMQNLIYLPSELKPFLYNGKFMASIKRDNAFPKLVSSRYKLSC